METTSSANKKKVCKAGCQSREVLDLIADKWTVLIIHSIGNGTLRHNEILRELEDISQKVLTQGLRKLERNGLVTRKIYPVVPPRVDYTLTPLGRSLVSVLKTLTSWAEGNFPAVIDARKRFDHGL
jgi:DNA-binding HxlR family transcriptional regulator